MAADEDLVHEDRRDACRILLARLAVDASGLGPQLREGLPRASRPASPVCHDPRNALSRRESITAGTQASAPVGNAKPSGMMPTIAHRSPSTSI